MVGERQNNSKQAALVLLLVATAAWGATFVVVKDAVAHMQVLGFLAWRFLIAGGLLAIVRPASLLRLGRRGWAQGVLLGLALAAGYVLQTYGLRHTQAAVSGFLTGLQVVFTPLLVWLLLRQKPGTRVWAATALATAGLAVISLRGFSFGLGEALTVASAAAFALQIVGLGYWAAVAGSYGLATVQLLTVAVCCLVADVPQGIQMPTSSGTWAAVVFTAVVATAFAFVVQSWAQAQISTARAAIVFTLEPVFAALAAACAGEQLGLPLLAGGALVIAAMLVVEVATWGPWLRSRRRYGRRSRRRALGLGAGAGNPDLSPPGLAGAAVTSQGP